MLQEIGRGLLHLVFPCSCHICECAVLPEAPYFCSHCRGELTYDPFPACPRCALAVGPYTHIDDDGCFQCRHESFHFECVRRLGPYTGLLRETILRMKHAAAEVLAELVGELWAGHADKQLRALRADVVVPVPLHWGRRFLRGYNPSECLAYALAKHLGLKCYPSWIRRIRPTPRQTRQSASARRANVRGAFWSRSRRALQGKTVLLIDDVLTTGSTCSEAARALRSAGAGRVVVAVLGRTDRVELQDVARQER